MHARHNITDAASPGSVPAREQSAWFGVDLRLEGTPLGSAQCIPASEVSQCAYLWSTRLESVIQAAVVVASFEVCYAWRCNCLCS